MGLDDWLIVEKYDKDEGEWVDVGGPIPADLYVKLEKLGYRELRMIEGIGVCGVMRQLFTVGVFLALDETGYRNRFCFDTWQNASLFLKEWDGETLPVVGDDGCTAIK